MQKPSCAKTLLCKNEVFATQRNATQCIVTRTTKTKLNRNKNVVFILIPLNVHVTKTKLCFITVFTCGLSFCHLGF
ncbi:hypothetical protein EON70_00075 [bacterium]|nr:MAG: hypothetical protein EON70_00075 [bacterium]